MKNLLTLSLLTFTFIFSNLISAQEYATTEDLPVNYKKRHAIYDYSEDTLSNTAIIPGFETKENKLKITGTIYLADGVTPAKDVMLYVFQSDEDGDYEMKRDAYRKRYVHHRGWIKTDADGRYTIYTFMPGKFVRVKELKQIHRVIKEPGKAEYNISPFFFNNDPLIPYLSLEARAIASRSMLRLEEEGGIQVATKDIILKESIKNLQ